AATFEDVLAASEALSRHFHESEEGEVPLLAFHAATASPLAFVREGRPLP
ncbi:hypothetical protein HY251_12200, partial [bacterium]|nr:hypothetical protein [bacterium]